MKVIHIIPGAFDYFNDIRSEAMELVDSQRELGIDAEAFVLQYSSVGNKQKKDVKHKTPNLEFVEMLNSTLFIESLSNYDVIHLHCPFLGLANKIIAHKKLNLEQPLVITYYRKVLTIDMFSFFIMCYNKYYLPKIFKLADAIFESRADLLDDGNVEFSDIISFYNSLIK